MSAGSDGKVEAAGIVLRNPAIGTARLCSGACPSADDGKPTDTTPVLAELDNIGVPQYGKRIVMPFKNVVLQNTTLAITLAADGTITSLGTHDMGTTNTVLTAVGTDAQAAASALQARASAITAGNTAAQAAAQMPDTVNKALADCLTQRNTIISLGGTPTVPCQ